MARKIPAKRATRPNPREDRSHPRYPLDRSFNIIPIRKVVIFPKSLAQEVYLDALEDMRKSIVIATGPAGTGKTYLATMFAIRSLIEGRFKKIIITRPTVSTGEDIGFLPGSLYDKLAPWSTPILDIFKEVYPAALIERMIKDEVVEIAPLGMMRGRAQPLDSIIQTPIGPRLMGDIKIGDFVLGSNGSATLVDGVFPQGKKPIYRVTFSDGVSTLASGDHIWTTKSLSERKHKKGFSTKTTEEILQSSVWKQMQRNHEVPIMSSPATFSLSDIPLPMNAYLLGLLLGDGSILDKSSISFATVDAELVQAISEILPDRMKITKLGYLDYRISWNQQSSHVNPMKAALRKVGLSGCRSYEKFVPTDYFTGEVKDRLAILQGLMDTDGTIWVQKDRAPRIQFSSTSLQLAKDTAYLVRSLGGIASVREREHDLTETRNDGWNIHHRRNSFIVEIAMPTNICPFRLHRKAMKFNKQSVFRFIDKIELVSEMECQCLSVTASDHHYLTDDFIVTHNTLKEAIILIDECQNATPSQIKMCATRIGEASKIVMSGDLRQHDRGFEVNGLKDFSERVRRHGSSRIAICEFGICDIERHPVVEEVLRIYGDN